MEKLKKYIIWGVCAVLVIILIILVSVYLYKTSPSYKIKTTLKTEISYFKNEVSKLNSATYDSLMKSKQLEKNKKSTYTSKPLTITTDLNFDVNIKNAMNKKNSNLSIIEDLLNNSETEIKTNADLNNKYIDGKLNYKHNNEKLNLNYYMKNDETYIYI